MKQPIGKMDRQITIQRAVHSQGDYGDPIVTYTDVATVWANVYSGGGREFTAARQINAEVTVQFQIRYMADLKRDMRIVYEGDYYDIDRIAEVGRRDRLDIFAKARVK